MDSDAFAIPNSGEDTSCGFFSIDGNRKAIVKIVQDGTFRKRRCPQCRVRQGIQETAEIEPSLPQKENAGYLNRASLYLPGQCCSVDRNSVKLISLVSGSQSRVGVNGSEKVTCTISGLFGQVDKFQLGDNTGIGSLTGGACVLTRGAPCAHPAPQTSLNEFRCFERKIWKLSTTSSLLPLRTAIPPL